MRDVSPFEDAVTLWGRGAVATPSSITTNKEGRFYRIVDYVLDPIPTLDEYRELHSTEAMGDFWGESEEVPF